MTSKEVVELIATNCAMNCKKAYHEKCNDNCEIFKAFQEIKKDLEILEILKELFSNNDYLAILLKTNYLYQIKDTTKLNKIKEWLEND